MPSWARPWFRSYFIPTSQLRPRHGSYVSPCNFVILLSNPFCELGFDHYSLLLMVLSSRTVLATGPRESSWYKQTWLFYRIQRRPFSLSTAICELVNSSRNPTDVITTSSYNVVVDTITDLCPNYPYPSKSTLKMINLLEHDNAKDR